MSDPIITTGFIEWCARQLAEPAAGGSGDIQPHTAGPDDAPDLTEFEVSIQLLHDNKNNIININSKYK